MEKQFYIHVGFMKTGTTHLQKNFFPLLESDQVYTMKTNDPIYSLLRFIVNANEFDAFSDSLKAELDGFLAGLKQSKIVISMEALVGLSLKNFANHHLIARCLRDYFANVHIIMVIRRQDHFFESLYVQSLHMGNFGSVRAFLNYEAGVFGPYRQRSQDGVNVDVHQLDYQRFYANYVNLFGAEKILVLPYELLRQNSPAFLGKICGCIGIEPVAAKSGQTANRSYSALSIVLSRFFNRLIASERNGLGIIVEKPFHKILFPRRNRNRFFRFLYAISNHLTVRALLQKYLDRLIYIKPKVIKPEIKAQILDLHRESNRQFDERLALGLKQYGYY